MNAEAVDPLATLRATLPGAVDDTEPALPAVAAWQPLRVPMSKDDRTALRGYLTGRMHSDDTAVGFLHRGGCGCPYIAGLLVDAITEAQL